MQKKARAFSAQQQFEQQEQEPPTALPSQQPQAPQLDWVERKGRASNFGAPVMFQDEPEDINTYTSSSAILRQAQDERTGEDRPATEDTTDPSTDNPEQDTQETSFDETASQENDPADNIADAETATASNEVALPDRVSDTYSEQPSDKPPVKKRTRRRKKRSPTSLKPRRVLHSLGEGGRAGRAKKESQSTQQTQYAGTAQGPKPPLSLSQLTQGFLNHLNSGGNSAISIMSNKRGRPTDEQLKYERYLQKISWCIQNSYNIFSDRCPPIPVDTSLRVHIAIKRDGTTQQLALGKSSQNLLLDAFTLQVFRDASSSFPPIPQYIIKEPILLGYEITVGASDGKNIRFYQR